MLLFVTALLLGAGQDPQGNESAKLTARELFYAAPAVQKISHPNQQARQKKPIPASRAGRPARPAATPPALPVAREESAPLGLRYSVLQLDSTGQYREVDHQTHFRSGDRIRVRVEANSDAHLYIVMRGSSGTWRLLFPAAEIEAGSNAVKAGKSYDLPPGGRFAFDEQPGEEKLFLVLSRQPEESIESLIYSLSAPGSTAPPQLLAQQRPIDDSVVDSLRGKVLARDLVFEKVDSRADAGGEKAVYIANPSTAADARLIAEISLLHR